LRAALRSLGLLEAARAIRLWLRAARWTRRNWSYLVSGAPDGLPLPPVRFVQAVSGEPDIAWFLRGGALAADAIRTALAEQGQDVARLPALLDFGCGCGRVIRHWARVEGEVHGTDYNPGLVAWCRRGLPFGRFEVNGFAPPLAYPDGRFDLVYALSVFTHLPAELQIPWMDELRRVLSPDGLLLLTVHGTRYRADLEPAERATFDTGNLVVRRDDSPGRNVCGVYHPEAYLRGTLARGYEVLAYVPEGALGNPHQDLVLLRRSS
jgi:SAM-dependent methyltransferase